MKWIEDAIRNLGASLHPVPCELNALDWKSGLSPKSERLAQHMSAFANNEGGGFFAFGVNNDATASRIIAEVVDLGLIKPFDQDGGSKKFSSYIPFYA